ncbi:MAG: DUF4837 family protein [Bacteroidales bacterium]|nr:DUF4837 family protein [Bacteroidales bacterium]MDT8432695.1 DUF4837 family protein [Bacteroidales bacterium]
MKYLLLFITSVLLVLSGCDTTVKTGDSGRILPNITGGAGEVLVVVDKYIWDGPTGELLKDLLQEEFPGLPQSEPIFDVTQISASSFDNMFRFHRSVVLVTIKEMLEEPAVRYRKNVWARPQILVQLEAQDVAQLQQQIRDNMEQIQGFLVQYDRQRLTDSYADSKDLEIQKMMAENHQVRLAIPRGYNIDLSTDNYSSVSIETPDFSQVLHVYEYPATTKAELQSGRIIENRNAFVKKYVKGPGDDSYMTTSMVYPPIFYDIQMNGTELVETRGLWELENGYMGGPFVSHSVFDEKRQRIVTVEGYVYYPNQKKRIKIRQLEAIIYSLEIF